MACFSQWVDSFDDGDFTNSPTWTGDTSLFVVEMGQLRLSAPAIPGTAALSVPSDVIDSATWTFHVRMAFNPSSNNYSKIYLVSDQPPIGNDIKGYFIKLGNTKDEVSLYRQDGNAETKIIDGMDGHLSVSNVNVSVLVTRSDSGEWNLSSKLDTEASWVNEGSASDATYMTSSYFGINCVYTSSRSTKFYFDDFVVTGQSFTDNIPPSILKTSAVDGTTIKLSFSERIDSLVALDNSNYLLNQTQQPFEIIPENMDLTLRFDSLTLQNILLVSGLIDSIGNVMNDTIVNVLFIDPSPLGYRDVVFNEMMIDPTPVVGLPNSEYIELENRSEKIINLQRLTMNDLSKSVALPDRLLFPDSLILLVPMANIDSFQTIANVVGLSPWTTLNNDGDQITLKGDSVLIDSVHYTQSWYHDLVKEDGGYSIEQIFPGHPCPGSLNWAASSSLRGGTPGEPNSILILNDTIPPIILDVKITIDTLSLVLDEPVDLTSVNAELNPGTVLNIQVEYNRLFIIPDEPLLSGQFYTLSLMGTTDCSGNMASTYQFSFTPDFIPPSIDSLVSYFPGELTIFFDEAINEPSTADFSILGIGTPGSLSFDVQKPQRVILAGWDSLSPGQSYTINVTGIADLFENVTNQSQTTFTYLPPQRPTFGEIVFSEIMADPDPTVGLPDQEYVELTNRTDKRLYIRSLWLSDATSLTTIPKGMLDSHERVILTKTTVISSFNSFGKVIGVPNWPSLNNRGDRVALMDSSGRVIHSLEYSDDWYGDESKSKGGWSLELIDLDNFCGGKQTWRASVDANGGTPGRVNSVVEEVPDLLIPQVQSAYLISSDTVVIQFSEQIGGADPVILRQPGNIGLSFEFITSLRDNLVLTLDHPIPTNGSIGLLIENLEDCAGNINTSIPVQAYLPAKASQQSVVINEVLFNPEPGEEDFVELYNRSSNFYDPKGWQISNGNNLRLVSEGHRLFPPYSFIVLTSDSAGLTQRYPHTPDSSVWQVDLPALPNAEGSVVLKSKNELVLDSMVYREEMHESILTDVEGISLERVDPDRSSLDQDNWHSASGYVDFATPGRMNSQSHEVAANGLDVQVNPRVVVPNGDGIDDETTISILTKEPGFAITIRIFNLAGRVVRHLVNNLFLGSQGKFTWDGRNDQGKVLPLGHYLIYIELHDNQGHVIRKREKVVVGSGF